MGRRALSGLAAVLLAASAAIPAEPLEGTLRSERGAALAGAFIALTDEHRRGLDYAVIGADGAFTFSAAPPASGHLVVQPPAREVLAGLETFDHTPRLYNLGGGVTPLDLRLPECGTVVLLAPNERGGLQRYGDFAARAGVSAPFVYVTDLAWNALPAAVWHVFGERIGQKSGSREEGLPALCVAPNQPFAVWLLFWETGHGKLALRMDNAGDGFHFEKAGDALALDVPKELARTAIHDLVRHRARYEAAAGADIDALVTALAEADAEAAGSGRDTALAGILTKALRLRDEWELESARAAVAPIRQGTLLVTVRDAAGNPVPGAKVDAEQTRNAFGFGVFEGNPYDAGDFARAHEAGFNLGTVLPAWGWSASPKANRGVIDRALGISAMGEAGLAVKAHGVVWFQDYGILPEEARKLAFPELTSRALAQQQSLLDVFGDRIYLWEAINEPAHTNVVGLPRDTMIDVMAGAAAQIREAGKTALVNSPHEWSYNAFGQFFGTDNRPADDYPMTYAAFLDLAAAKGALDDIAIIGLQFYPGYRLGGGFAEVEGPAFAPGYLRDLLDLYARFGKTLHITEFSLPSNYEDHWNAGYWREKWNETTQADYAEALFTIAYAHPATRSMTWWDLRDSGAAIQFGGLLQGDGSPKPAFDRLATLFGQWRQGAAGETDASGQVALTVHGGAYALRAALPGGGTVETTHTVIERFINTVDLIEGE
jgi:hypothetical protein